MEKKSKDNKEGEEVELKKEIIKSKEFKPDINLPSQK